MVLPDISIGVVLFLLVTVANRKLEDVKTVVGLVQITTHSQHAKLEVTQPQ